MDTNVKILKPLFNMNFNYQRVNGQVELNPNFSLYLCITYLSSLIIAFDACLFCKTLDEVLTRAGAEIRLALISK